jgi:hypothetical protein
LPLALKNSVGLMPHLPPIFVRTQIHGSQGRIYLGTKFTTRSAHYSMHNRHVSRSEYFLPPPFFIELC